MIEKQDIIDMNCLINDLNDNKYPGITHFNELKEKIDIYFVPSNNRILNKQNGLNVSYITGDKMFSFILINDKFYNNPENKDKLDFIIYHEVGHFTLHKHHVFNKEKYTGIRHYLVREIEANLYAAFKMEKNKKEIILILKESTSGYRKKILYYNDILLNNNKKEKILATLFSYYSTKLISYYYIKYRT